MDKKEDQSEDLWETFPPVDVVAKLDEDFFDLVASAKWSERKEALSKFAVLLDVPRLKQVSYTDVNRILQKVRAQPQPN